MVINLECTVKGQTRCRVEVNERLAFKDAEIALINAELESKDRTLHKLKLTKIDLEKDESRKVSLLMSRNGHAGETLKLLKPGRGFRPPMLDMKPKDESYCDFLETAISHRDLEAFYFHEIDDLNDLLNETRKRGLRSNTFNHLPHSMTRNPPDPPKAKLENSPLKAHLVAFVGEMFIYESPVKNYLLNKHKLNEIPVFSADADPKTAQNMFDTYFIGSDLYRTTRMKYSPGEKMESLDGLQKSKRFLVKGSGNGNDSDYAEWNEVKRKIEELEEKKKLIEEEYVNECKNRDGIKTELAELGAAIVAEKAKLREIELLKTRLETERNMLKNTLNPPPGQDYEKKRAELTDERNKLISALVDALKDTQNLAKEQKEAEFAVRKIETKLQINQSLNSFDLEEHRVASEEFRRLEAELQRKTREMEAKREEVHEKFNRLKNSFKEFKVPEELMQRLKAYGDVDEMSRLVAKIHETNQALRAEKAKFPELKRQIAAEIDKRFTVCQREFQQVERELTEALRLEREETCELKRRVEGLVDAIDAKFKKLMSRLGYAGSVELSAGDEDLAEESKIGLSIKVAFGGAETATLQPLSASTQSGGEKSVSTALYMMALQELTKVPFRCVDEINQGMDQRNERLVWDLLLETAKNYSAQYIYVSPKFPRGLPFDDVNVVVCFKGLLHTKDNHCENSAMSNVDSYIDSLEYAEQ